MFPLLLIITATIASSSDQDVKRAVTRSLPYLEQGGLTWMKEQGCVSCHRITFMIWSHNEARLHGIDVDDDKVDRWTDWAFVSMLAKRKDGGGIDTMSQMLLGRDRSSKWRKKPPLHFKTSDPYETLYDFLLERQSDDGSWPPEGQLTTPPEITTGWALFALASRDDKEGDPAAGLIPAKDMGPPLEDQVEAIEERLPESRERALAYLQNAEPHESNESLVLRAIRERTFDSQEQGPLLKRLISRQNVDGGWSNRLDQTESDAYATGQTLYGLSLIGVSHDHPAIRKARTFLLRTQLDDGSWLVPAQRAREGSRGESLDEVFTYWGSAWAAIGLLRTLAE